eukprot:scaffold18269_cov71-Phaeocystis_antarctica.AAC.11
MSPFREIAVLPPQSQNRQGIPRIAEWHLDGIHDDRRAPELELLSPQRVASCPLRHALHGRTRTAQEGRHGIVRLDDGAEGQRAPELQLVPADVVVMHGKHSATVEPLLAQWPSSLVVAMLEHGCCARTCSLVKAVAVEKAGLVERGHRQRLRRPLRRENQGRLSLELSSM